MKLWLQSCGDLGVNPMWANYERALKRHFAKVARPDTEIKLNGTRAFSGRTNRFQYDVYLHTAQLIEFAIQAEREGYDAYVQIGMQDYGFLEIREAVSIPVVFPVETALHVASLVAPKIGFFCYGKAMLERLNAKAKAYGFNDRVTAGGSAELTPADLNAGFENPEPLLKILHPECEKIARQEVSDLMRQQQDRLRQMLGKNFDPAMLESPGMRAELLEGLINQRLLTQYAVGSHMLASDDLLREIISASSAPSVVGVNVSINSMLLGWLPANIR